MTQGEQDMGDVKWESQPGVITVPEGTNLSLGDVALSFPQLTARPQTEGPPQTKQ